MRVPTKRTVILLLFILSELALTLLYLGNREWLEHMSYPILRYSVMPSAGHYLGERFGETPAAGGAAQSVPVLVYEGIVDREDGSNVLIQDFKDQMFALERAGYTAISYDEFVAFIRNEADVPEKSFLLTFDDGRADSYYPVDPLLRALDYRATIFVSTRSVGQEGFLGSDRLKSMNDSSRWSVQVQSDQGHGYVPVSADGKEGHYYTNFKWLEDQSRLESVLEYRRRVNDDLKNAKEDLRGITGEDPVAFAFPFGDYGQQSLNNDAATGLLAGMVSGSFDVAFAQKFNDSVYTQNYKGQDSRRVTRIKVYPGWDGANLLAVVEGGSYKQIPYYDDFSGFNGWIGRFGKVTIDGGNMILESTETGNGARAVLDGTYGWEDYAAAVSVDFENGGNVILFSRYVDSSRYASCSFNGSMVRFEEKKDGSVKRSGEARVDDPGDKHGLRLAIADRGDSVACLVDDEVVIESGTARHNGEGGFGIEVWSKNRGKALLKVDDLSVESLENR